MISKKTQLSAALALAWLAIALASPAIAQNQPASQVTTVTGITKPSVHAKLNLNQLGTIRELPITDGQLIKKGDLLLQQDDRAEVAALEALQLEADSTVRIEASKADLKAKQIELDRKRELLKTQSASPSEVEEAEVKVVYADAQVKIAELEVQKNKLEANRQRVRVEQMKLTSPIDGRVDRIDVSVGEIAGPDLQRPVMALVQLDPLWVEFFLPTAQSLKLKVGQKMQVRYEGQPEWLEGEVIYRAPVADASAGMQMLRLALKNPQNMDAGLSMEVKLPPELTTAPQK